MKKNLYKLSADKTKFRLIFTRFDGSLSVLRFFFLKKCVFLHNFFLLGFLATIGFFPLKSRRPVNIPLEKVNIGHFKYIHIDSQPFKYLIKFWVVVFFALCVCLYRNNVFLTSIGFKKIGIKT